MLCIFMKTSLWQGLQFLQYSKDALCYFDCAEQTQAEKKSVWGSQRKICWAAFQGSNVGISKCSLPDLNQGNDPSVVYKSVGHIC